MQLFGGWGAGVGGGGDLGQVDLEGLVGIRETVFSAEVGGDAVRRWRHCEQRGAGEPEIQRERWE